MLPFVRDQIAAFRDRVASAPAFHRFVMSNALTRPIALKHTRRLFDVVSGFVYAQTLTAFAELGVAQRLANGPVEHDVLAQDLSLTPHALSVLMNAAASQGLVERRRKGWGLGLSGAALLGQGGVLEMIAHHKHFYADLADPVRLLRGEGPTELASFWSYAAGAKEGSADAEGYTRLMAASQTFVSAAVLHARCFRDARHIFDIGGGSGAFALAALAQHPALRITVGDLPDVTPHAESAFAAAGVTARAEAVPFDMFKDTPPAEPDVFTLVRILHDHDDDAVAHLLRNVASARPDATVVIAEPMADRRHPSGFDAYFPWYFRAMGQGRYRTLEELRALLDAAGFRHVINLPTRNKLLVRGLIASVRGN